ncbi:MAG: methylated-DNA--[protein]-cysteine S-methyltransferase [Lachnospiraceae bacterium]|nr:methylated-DNA--[protein]-cysteine S-methyltransferase [Lachnospiraceae bacterium]
MQYTTTYQTPMGEMLLAADETGLTGLWFDEGRYFAEGLNEEHEEKELPVFASARRWLDIYFDGRDPDFMPPLHMIGSPFRLSVWKHLLEIPYGMTATYGELAKIMAEERGLARMSAQAVGGAVGHNPISIIVPCHRVIGANGSLTGYGGGLDKKERLLALEGIL